MTSTNPMESERPLPAWFDDAKFGIFIHWMPAAIPAFSEPEPPDVVSEMGEEDFDWGQFFRNAGDVFYWNGMSIPGGATAKYHAEHYGDLPYEAFVEEFRAGLASWDPEPWADLFAQSGARYIVFVVKEADGFLMWPSAHHNPHRENWQVERDVVGELAAAVRARGIRFGIMYAAGQDWTFGGIPVTDLAAIKAAEPDTDEYVAYADAHYRELVGRYQPSVLWNDYGYTPKADSQSLYDWYVEQVPDGVVNDRMGGLSVPEDGAVGYHSRFGDFTTTELGMVLEQLGGKEQDFNAYVEGLRANGRKWENCRMIGSGWLYNRQDTDATHASSTELVQELVDLVARGGNLLLDVGPTGTGDIPWEQAVRLLAMGWWLRTNGSAVYDTRTWDVPAAITDDGLEVRFTATDDAVNSIVLTGPSLSTSLELKALSLPVELEGDATVELLGHQGPLTWESTDRGVRVTLPEAPTGSPAIALRMTPRSRVRPGLALRSVDQTISVPSGTGAK